MKTKWLKCLGLCLLPLAATVARADSITPGSVSAIIDEGTSVTVHKTVTVTAGTPTTSKVDVYFLADTTGSMGGAIGAVKNSATSILSSIASLGDVNFGVGEYKDFPTYPWGEPGDYAYKLNQAMTGNQGAAQAGINAWGASGGWDTPESQLQALSSAAGSTTGWRSGSARILVWFGDAPGHEPSNTPGYTGPSTADTIATLKAANIKVEALDMYDLNGYGQATEIAAATGGDYYTGIDSSSIVDKIKDAITASFAEYTTVGLDTSEVPDGIEVSVTPGSYTGSFDRSIDRTFGFDITFTGTTPGTYDFNVYGTVDGGRVATESDNFTVKEVSPPGVPDGGATGLLLACAMVGLATLRGRKF